MLALIAVAAGAGLYALYLELRRARSLWKLVRWLETERPDEWGAVHVSSANIEDSMAKLRTRRLADDTEFIERHTAATSRGRHMAIAVVVAGTAILLILAIISLD